MQKDVKHALLSTTVFAGELTLVWSALSSLASEIFSTFLNYNLDSYVDIIVGITMISVALALLAHKNKGDLEKRADYKIIWIHGIAAAFGGDFIVVLILTLASISFIPYSLGFLIGFLFGLGSWISQSIVVALIYKGMFKMTKDVSIMIKAGRLSLFFLGIFMITLGMV